MDNKAKANYAEQTRSVDDSKRVTVAKIVAASQVQWYQVTISMADMQRVFLLSAYSGLYLH